MQWASSITSNPLRRPTAGRTSCRNSGLASRSGEINKTSTSSAAIRSLTPVHSLVFELLMVSARIPSRSAASIWLRIRASSGDTSSVGPDPLSRSIRVAMKYTALFPQPVRCTSSTRTRSPTSLKIASSWSDRNTLASSPVSRRSRLSASAPSEDTFMETLMARERNVVLQ